MDSIKEVKEKIKLHNWAQIKACMATYYRHLKLVRQAALNGSFQYPTVNEESFSEFAEIT